MLSATVHSDSALLLTRQFIRLHESLPMVRIRLIASLLLLVSTFANADESQSSLRWEFEGLDALPGERVGKIDVVAAELQQPQYPEFETGNSVLKLNSPSWIRIPDSSDDSRFDFDNGDAVTLEAWVRLNSMGENVYLVGKGRTGTSGPKAINQNWAFRLRKVNGVPCVNFLFRSRKSEEHPGDWHRWTSKTGITKASRWHHVAVSYKFGDPKSIVGVIDGKKVTGSWDMGGPTTQPPVIDDDDVWIGSSMAGNKGNSLDGWIDNLAIHRQQLPVDELLSRYQWNPPPVVAPAIPTGKVVVQLFESGASVSEIPLAVAVPLTQWQQDEFGFVRLPHKYDDWGIREDWGSTLLIRAWADITLPPGEHKLLARSRGMSRLQIDGVQQLTTAPLKKSGGAHNVVVDLPEVPVPGMRPAAMGDDEKLVTFQSDGKAHRFLWEIIVGGPKYRAEFGETCLAVAQADGMFHILSDVSQYPLTDDGWAAFSSVCSQRLAKMDQKNRSSANQHFADYWDRRHEHAKQTLTSANQIATIDELIQRDVNVRNATVQPVDPTSQKSEEAVFYSQHVQPIFDAHCIRCHGQKEQGGLLVVDRDRLLTGGESGQAAIVPGKPHESYLLELVSAGADDYRMPPKGEGLSQAEVSTLRQWIADGALMPSVATPRIEWPKLVDDHKFLRRVFIDTVGVPPSLAEANEFLADASPGRRSALIDRLLADVRWADNWTGYWQDVLAENPNLLKPTLNNTGPFRYWIHEALTDNKPIDRFATELILMRGSKWSGGSAGFAEASQNDVPMAAKAHVIGSAFLGVDMKCARCHDAPYHEWKQGDLFQMAAMLDRKSLKLPTTSTVPVAFFEKQQRESLIEVTLQPGAQIDAHFPFAELAPQLDDALLQNPADTREQLATQVTGSRRFAEVIANRMWKRLMGAGIVEPVDDWEGNPPSNPQLLAALADMLIANNYDVKQLARQIFESEAYQREAIDTSLNQHRHFAGPYRRRMSAEQIVDSAFHASGQQMQTERLTMDVEGIEAGNGFLNYGYPQRSWEFTTLANERDRPSLALPRVQAIADVLKAFGWRNSRPEPLTDREEAPNLIQPAVLANGTVGVWLTRLSDDSAMTKLMLEEQTVEQLVDRLFLQMLTRRPTAVEREQFVELLRPDFEHRVVPAEDIGSPYESKRFRYVSWSNHLNTEANVIKMEMQELVRKGPPPTRFLQPAWRERAEDAMWALLNSPEMILIP